MVPLPRFSVLVPASCLYSQPGHDAPEFFPCWENMTALNSELSIVKDQVAQKGSLEHLFSECGRAYGSCEILSYSLLAGWLARTLPCL